MSTLTLTDGIGPWLEGLAHRRGGRPAILAPGQPPLSYARLHEQVASTAATLRRLGVGRRDRVAVMLPNGPETATAFLSIAAAAACAPLNPGLTTAAIEFCLRDLRTTALVLPEGTDGPPVQAAGRAGVPVLWLRRAGQAAGVFELTTESIPADASPDATWTSGDDVALLLYTSGTTSRPKLVPLPGSNLLASAGNIVRTLDLRPDDCCLNIMPLFHIHGLVAAILATLRAGAGVVCTDGRYGARFFEWFDEFRPSWYSAVPTMHQAVLRQARNHTTMIRRGRLRLVRSSSASLAPRVFHELERVLGVPVIEAYGMTEASHQVASNPLPPAARKPGSVGPAAGPEIAVVDDDGSPLPAGRTGEVVIRGKTVTPGYVTDLVPTDAVFTGDWFRTGDLGRLDEDGYLYLTGRRKELINRGGEKISPREIDEALLNHPAVRQAVTFAIPHRQLGEDIGAAVELKSAAAADEHELRRYATGVLPGFKIPRVIRIVDEIPTGATGKLERGRLAALLEIPDLDDDVASPYLAPRNEIEQRVATIWQRLLGLERVSVHDPFVALGGDSLLAARMLVEISEAEGVDPAFTRFLNEGTIEAIAADVAGWSRDSAAGLVAVQSGRCPRALFCVPGHDGLLVGFSRLARELGPDQTIWAFQFTEPVRTLAELARRCVHQMTTMEPRGPYRLMGVCFGGLVAFEMARQLRDLGSRVELLALVDTLDPTWRQGRTMSVVSASLARQLRAKLAYHGGMLRNTAARDGARYLTGRVKAFFQHHGENVGARVLSLGAAEPRRGRSVKWWHRRLALEYRPGPYEGDALIVTVRGRRPGVRTLGWDTHVEGKLEEVEIPFHPQGALAGGNAARVADILLRRAIT